MKASIRVTLQCAPIILFAIACLICIAISSCGKVSKSAPLEDWSRPRYHRTVDKALVHYAVYGNFTDSLTISSDKYGTSGLPSGVTCERYSRKSNATSNFPDLETYAFSQRWKKENPDYWKKIASADNVLLISGEIDDPPNLNYMRDCIGVVTACLDAGGTAVVDLQQFKWWLPSDWRAEVFKGGRTNLSQQVSILVSEDVGGPDSVWFHTRGMRKFARPDISINRVTQESREAVVEMIRRFIDMQIEGAVVDEGREIKMKGLPSGLVCHYAGSLGDPNFNNRHIEIVWPTSKILP